MAKATVHPDHRLISSEDVQGTSVYGVGEEAIGEIDHLLIEKVSGRVSYAVMSFGGIPRARAQSLSGPVVGAQIRHQSRRLPHRHHGRSIAGCPRIQRQLF